MNLGVLSNIWSTENSVDRHNYSTPLNFYYYSATVIALITLGPVKESVVYSPGYPIRHLNSLRLEMMSLFIIARTWKQPRCPSADEWIRKLWYIYTMEYYSAIKKNTFESVLMRRMKLEPIIQSEVSQKEKINVVY